MHQFTQLVISQKSRGATAQMQLGNHLSLSEVLDVKINLTIQIPKVGGSTIVVLGNDLVAGAVIAK